MRNAVGLHERDEVVEPGLLVALDLPDHVVDPGGGRGYTGFAEAG